MVLSLTFLVTGLIILTIGADRVVDSSSKLAIRLGVKPLIVGLTVVAFGTSAPEFVVSIQSCLAGAGGISIGNVVGSNICNVALILGLSALICPMVVSRQLFKFDMPVCIAASLLALLFLRDGTLSVFEGAVFAVMFIGYIAYCFKTGKIDDTACEIDTATAQKGSAALDVIFIIIGLGMLVGGSHLFVRGAVEIARGLGVSETVIGLTIVAIGTSLPELATSAAAAVKKQNDIAIGNIVGSNLFNIMLVLGTVGLLGPTSSEGLALRDTLLMIGLIAALFIPLLTKNVLGRAVGGVFFATYAVYMITLCREALLGG